MSVCSRAFCVCVARRRSLDDLWAALPASELRVHLQETIATVERVQQAAGITAPSLLNFVLSDGCSVIASRYASGVGAKAATLYFSWGTSFERDEEHVTVEREKSRFYMAHTDRRPGVARPCRNFVSGLPHVLCLSS